MQVERKRRDGGASHAAGTYRALRSNRPSHALGEINVTPLVDVVLVLLLVFMVTAPMMSRGIDVSLPVANQPQNDAEDRITVSVNAREQIFIGDKPVNARAARGPPARHDGGPRGRRSSTCARTRGCATASVIAVVDKIKKAGVEQIGFAYVLPAGEGTAVNDPVDAVLAAARSARPRLLAAASRLGPRHTRCWSARRCWPRFLAPAEAADRDRRRLRGAAARAAAAAPRTPRRPLPHRRRPSRRRRNPPPAPEPEPPKIIKPPQERRARACPTSTSKKAPKKPEPTRAAPRSAPPRRVPRAPDRARGGPADRHVEPAARPRDVAGRARRPRRRGRRRLLHGRRAAEDLDALDAAGQERNAASRSASRSRSWPTAPWRRHVQIARSSGRLPARQRRPARRADRGAVQPLPKDYGTNRITDPGASSSRASSAGWSLGGALVAVPWLAAPVARHAAAQAPPAQAAARHAPGTHRDHRHHRRRRPLRDPGLRPRAGRRGEPRGLPHPHAGPAHRPHFESLFRFVPDDLIAAIPPLDPDAPELHRLAGHRRHHAGHACAPG